MDPEQNEPPHFTQYSRYQPISKSPNPWPHGHFLEQRSRDKNRRQKGERADEVDISQSNQSRSFGSTLPGDPNDPKPTKDKYAARVKEKLRKFRGAQGPAGQQDTHMLKLEDHPEDGNPEDSELGSTAGEETMRLRTSSPIARAHEADKSIISRFEDLYAGLRTWSAPFATEQNMDRLDLKQMAIIQKVMPDAWRGEYVSSLVANPRSRRHLLEAIVSYVIFSRIFPGDDEKHRSSPSLADAWMSTEMARSVHIIETTLKESKQEPISPRELNELRALCLALLSQTQPKTSLVRRVDEEAGRLAKHIMNLLESWHPAEESHPRLANLIKSSIELSRLLRTQRAFWFVAYKHETTDETLNRFDAGDMVDVDDDDNWEDISAVEGAQSDGDPIQPKQVLFKIFPGLFKRGNADGLDYDIEECRVKIKVKVA